MTLQEIYHTLSEGKKVTLQFATKAEADYLRSRLANLKYRLEKPAIDAGLLEKTSLYVTWTETDCTATYEICAPRPRVVTEFNVLSIS